MGDDGKKLVLKGIQLRQLVGLFFQQCGLTGNIGFLPQDLQVTPTQLPVLIPALVLVPRILVLDQQQAIKDKEDREQVVENIT